MTVKSEPRHIVMRHERNDYLFRYLDFNSLGNKNRFFIKTVFEKIIHPAQNSRRDSRIKVYKIIIEYIGERIFVDPRKHMVVHMIVMRRNYPRRLFAYSPYQIYYFIYVFALSLKAFRKQRLPQNIAP